ncbi:unnamed protein product, partial [Symbiodinium pilosum]
ARDVEVVIQGLGGELLMTLTLPKSTRIRDVARKLKEAKPEWQSSRILFTREDQVFKAIQKLAEVEIDRKFEVTATATQSLQAIQRWCHELFEEAIAAEMDEEEYADVPFEKLPLDSLADTHLYSLLHKEFGDFLPKPLHYPN